MKIIEPSFEILKPASKAEGIVALRFIECQSRISHRSEDSQTEETWGRFIEAVVLKRGDWSVVEHSSATVRFRVDRGVSHELVRHRLFSYTQESTRFVNGDKKYPDGLEFIVPEELHPASPPEKWKDTVASCEQAYLSLIRNGVRPQEARSVLPNALATTVAMTGNLRSWRWFLLARTTKESHPDMRRVTIPLLKKFQERVPLLFDDIVPLERQAVSMARVH